MLKYSITLSLCFLVLFSKSQTEKHFFGAPQYVNSALSGQKSQPLTVQNGNGSIATSYTATACGLNYTQASVRLEQRTFSMPIPTGVPQPATYSISGIPPCASIIKAFLYAGVSGNGIPITANITNPLSASTNFTMGIIGNHIDKCWSYPGTFSYRADVTSIISGNGNYIISGMPVAIGTNDTDGATLLIIYSDPTQNYTGSIVIADGCYVAQGGFIASNISGFNVCGPTSLTTNFIIAGDFQQLGISALQLNSSTVNYNYPTASQNIWDFIQAPGAAAVAGQTSATYGINNPSDCFSFVAAGMYYRTNCNTCVAPSFSISTAVSSSCTVGSATATPLGGVGPYTYTWSPSGGNSSVITGASIGVYTVTVKDASCSVGVATVAISSSPTVAVSNQTICSAVTATIIASGATTYSWSTGAGTSQIVVSPTTSTIYTVTGYNGPCSDTKTVSVTVGAGPIMSASTSNSFICAGQTVTLSASGAVSYTYNPGGITGNPIALSPTVSTTYTVLGNNGGPCISSVLISQAVSPCTDINQIAEQNVKFDIYPNPNNGEFELLLINQNETSVIEIYNSIGQLIKRTLCSESNLKIKINEAPDGIYHLRIIQNGVQVYRTKLIKE